MARCQRVVAVVGGKNHSDPGHQQGARQAIDDGVHQCPQVRLGTESAAKLDQRCTVVISFAIEDAVHPFLNGTLQRIEYLRRQDDGNDQAPGSEAGQVLVHHFAGYRDQAEVDTDHGGRRERVGDAAFEDQVHVHQPVANDGPAEGQRQDDQRNDGQLLHQDRNRDVGQVRNDVQQRERSDREQGSPGKPLQLLLSQRSI